MTQVIKRGGRKQKFMPEKIKRSIRRAAAGVRISPVKIRELVNDVGNSVIDLFKKKRIAKTTDIRKSVLGRLDRRMKSVALAWKRIEKKKKK